MYANNSSLLIHNVYTVASPISTGEITLAGFEQHDSLVTQVKEYEVLCFVRDERTKVPSYNAMPVW
jgi:hypothetical protein